MRQLFLLLSFIYAVSANGQYKDLVQTDPQHDVSAFVIDFDIKSVLYKVDIAEDQIEFKIASYDTVDISKSIGFAFGLDTNQTQNDGMKWPGYNMSVNGKFKYDHLVAVYKQNGPAVWKGTMGVANMQQDISSKISVSTPDKSTFIITAPLSYFEKDAKFDIVVGVGDESAGTFSFIGTIRDAAPNDGSATIEVNTTSVKQISSTGFRIYPNPAKETLYVKLPDGQAGNYSIISIEGNRVMAGNLKSAGSLNVAHLPAGNYIFSITTEAQQYSTFITLE